MKSGVATGLLVLALHVSAAAAPKTVTLALDGTAAAPTTKAGDGLTSTMQETEGLKLTVTCGANLDCTKVKLSSAAVPPSPAPQSAKADAAATKEAVTFAIPAEPAKISVLYDNKPLYTIALSTGAAPTGTGSTTDTPAPAPTPTPTLLSELLATRCSISERTVANNEVVVTPRGTLLSPPPSRFSESDTLTVTVIGDDRLVNALSVKRKSSLRTVSQKILGEDIAIPRAELVRHTQREPACIARSFHVGDFAPGAGEVELSAQLGTESAVLGSFQILIDPVYAGMFSIGAAWTPILAPEFGVALRDGQQVITQSETGDRRLAYAFLFTPFLWEGLERNPRRPFDGKRFWHHINPSVGFLLNDPIDNVLVGATLDIQSTILFTYGSLFSRVTRLDGATVGQPFEGAASDIPTTKSWKHRWFVGISVDLRVGVKLLRAVLGTASGGG